MARAGTNHKGGRPKGSKSKGTLEREAVIAAFRQRAMHVADLLLDSQLTLARGQTFLYKIEKEWVPSGKDGFYKKKKPVLVESQAEIEQYLEGHVVEGDPDDDHDPAATYYFITTKEPDNNAIDSILDRTFGRPTNAMDLNIPGGMKITFDPIFNASTRETKGNSRK